MVRNWLHNVAPDRQEIFPVGDFQDAPKINEGGIGSGIKVWFNQYIHPPMTNLEPLLLIPSLRLAANIEIAWPNSPWIGYAHWLRQNYGAPTDYDGNPLFSFLRSNSSRVAVNPYTANLPRIYVPSQGMIRYAIMRDAWNPTTRWVGFSGHGEFMADHQQNDAGSFWIWKVQTLKTFLG